ncbi:alpha/beta fold hydrolase [Streptomyces sp. B-S-A8]|uniref:Alpha/beta fold hydrolase n=1 Tax=Streptomyces solicavernae TaxID=3043614 RepID=A0ABT6S239_9ACTN|nr:alpha/beta fold hydrolase [Streptomyces sp. B-S-A8]MDI3389966.1 alpha/beta fold hydrolase [Streptomyces sp. B-S-A8]
MTAAGRGTDAAWFRELSAGGAAGLRLYCFPHAGGSAGAYGGLSRALAGRRGSGGRRISVAAAQYPGRQDRYREAPLEDLGRIADVLAAEIEERGEQPYALFGHSMGAVIAYETARRLQRSDAGPERLFVSGRGAPSKGAAPGDQPAGDQALLTQVRRLGGTGGRALADPELMRMALPALRADYRALRSYAWVPGEALRCPLTVLIGDTDPTVTTEAVAAWRELATGAVSMRMFPGGHFYLDAFTEELAELVSDALPEAAWT